MLSVARRIIVGALICLLAFGPTAMAEDLPHKISLSPGIILENDKSTTSDSIGLGYEYRINRLWGVGVMGEAAGHVIDAFIVGVPVLVYPYGGWFVLAAPGVEFGSGETSVMVRLGTGYDFKLGKRFSLAPEFDVDLNRNNGTKYVFRLSLSWAF